MPPSMFNEMGPNVHWEALTEARAMYESSTAPRTSGISAGQLLLVSGAAILAAICVAMALVVG